MGQMKANWTNNTILIRGIRIIHFVVTLRLVRAIRVLFFVLFVVRTHFFFLDKYWLWVIITRYEEFPEYRYYRPY